MRPKRKPQTEYRPDYLKKQIGRLKKIEQLFRDAVNDALAEGHAAENFQRTSEKIHKLNLTAEQSKKPRS